MACCLGLYIAGVAQAHDGLSSLSDPLTSFNAGLFTVFGGGAPEAVTYDAAGAHFGTASAGDSGRNYQRTIDADYAQVSFKAEITFELSTAEAIDDNGTPDNPLDDFTYVVGDRQAVFIGLGSGDTALFGTPDWSTQLSSASFWPEANNNKFVRFRTHNDQPGQFVGDTLVPGFDPGTHRFRMTFNSGNNQLLGQIDLNYVGGPFVADAVMSNFPIVVTPLKNGQGWYNEPSRIFFGGDDGVIFRDLVIMADPVPEPASLAIVLLGTTIMFGVAHRRKR
jgi:hypothetical protein